ncbi:MAG: flagellar hook-length control protein FliK [Limnochordales bacterium]|nr:flagellar hook-length control protein FliK [Limnochordales bacterium]
MQIISLPTTPEMAGTQRAIETDAATRNTSAALGVSWAAILALLAGGAEAASRAGGPPRTGTNHAQEKAALKQATPATTSNPAPAASLEEPVKDERSTTERRETGEAQGSVDAVVQDPGGGHFPAGFMPVLLLPSGRQLAERCSSASATGMRATAPPAARPVAAAPSQAANPAGSPEASTRALPFPQQLSTSPPPVPVTAAMSSVRPAGLLAKPPGSSAVGGASTDSPANSVPPSPPSPPSLPLRESSPSAFSSSPPSSPQLPPPAPSLRPAVSGPAAGPSYRETPLEVLSRLPAVPGPVRLMSVESGGEAVRSQLLLGREMLPAGLLRVDAGGKDQSLSPESYRAAAPSAGSRIAATESTAPLLQIVEATAVPVEAGRSEEPAAEKGLAGWVRPEPVEEESPAVRVLARPAPAEEQAADRPATSLPSEHQSGAVAQDPGRPLPPDDTDRGKLAERWIPDYRVERATGKVAFSPTSDQSVEPSSLPLHLTQTDGERAGNSSRQEYREYTAGSRQFQGELDAKAAEGVRRASDLPAGPTSPDRQELNPREQVLSRELWESGAVTGTRGDPSDPSPNRPVALAGASFSHRLLDEVERLQQLREERQLSSPVHRISMLLEPPELGMVEATVDLRHGEVRIRMTAHTAAGEAVLSGQLDSLRAAITERGLAVGELRVVPAGSTGGAPWLEQAASGFFAGQGFQGDLRRGWYRPGEDELPPVRAAASRRRSTGRSVMETTDGADTALPPSGRPWGIAAGGLDVTA